MHWSKTLIPTSKAIPADAQIVSHQLMLRAGLIRQLTAGVYDFLPLGLRALHKAAAIVRQEMQAVGAVEVLLPALQPLELWQKTGRDKTYGENLMQSEDRHGRQTVLGPTSEEVCTELVGAYVNSYKQLPLTLFQIQSKFRDEYRPRFGLLRVREFLMKDAYSFHADSGSLDHTYDQMVAAYQRIFARCGVPVAMVEAESGAIGGSESHEFLCPAEAGEDTIVTSDKGNYAANIERAETGTRPHSFASTPTAALERVHTPNLPSIEAVSQFLHVKPSDLLKTLVFRATPQSAIANPQSEVLHDPRVSPAQPKWLVAVVRGDHEVNEGKLARLARERFNIAALTMATGPDVAQAFAIGFVGPDAAIRNAQAVLVIDPDAAQPRPWVAGANAPDYHVRHFDWFRECGDRLADPTKVLVADIRNVLDGDPSPKADGGTLHLSRGIELGHVFKLGTRYTEPLGAQCRDESGVLHPMLMGTYGIGIGRLLVAAIEAHHDERGILWPPAIAPYSVVLTPIQYTGQTKEVADKLHAELNSAGIDTILDDRDARPGFKFADADLVGFPLRINIGEKGLKDGKVELKWREAKEAELVAVDNVLAMIQGHNG